MEDKNDQGLTKAKVVSFFVFFGVVILGAAGLIFWQATCNINLTYIISICFMLIISLAIFGGCLLKERRRQKLEKAIKYDKELNKQLFGKEIETKEQKEQKHICSFCGARKDDLRKKCPFCGKSGRKQTDYVSQQETQSLEENHISSSEIKIEEK